MSKTQTKTTGIKSVLHKMTIMSISENALLDGVVKQLVGREAFKDATDNKEVIYQGDVFEAILSDMDEFEASKAENSYLHWAKVRKQITELAELVDTDYVLITKS